MTERLVVQLLEETPRPDTATADPGAGSVDRMDTPIELPDMARRFRWGIVDDLSNWYAVSHEGSDEDLLLSLEGQTRPLTLLIPGNKVVTLPVSCSKKEARHFLKLLPYQVEDDVLGAVEDLYFVAGHRETDVVTVAYVDEQWLSRLLQWFADHYLGVDTCLAEYQCLAATGNELILWFTDGAVWGHRANGLGFGVSQNLARAFLKDLLINQQDMENPWQIRVFVDDAEIRETVQNHLMPAVPFELVIGQPMLDFARLNQLNFCRGKYGKKVPVAQWWREARPLAILAAAATVVFLVATFVDIYHLQQQREEYQTQLNAAYRSVVPRGPAGDPVRRLKSMLDDRATVAEPSQSIYLLSKIAPVMESLNINLTTLNYSHRDQVLRVNVSAASFADIEAFRQQLDQQGIAVELRSSNAATEGYQARLSIGLQGDNNG